MLFIVRNTSTFRVFVWMPFAFHNAIRSDLDVNQLIYDWKAFVVSYCFAVLTINIVLNSSRNLFRVNSLP